MMRWYLSWVLAGLIYQPALADNYNETIDGDLSGDERFPTILNLSMGSNIVEGTVGGPYSLLPDADYFDVLGFRIPEGYRVEQVIIESFVQVSSPWTVTDIYSGIGGTGGAGATHLLTEDDAGADLLESPDLGTLPDALEGDWRIRFTEGTPDQRYRLNLVVVPSPASAAVLGPAVLAAARRRR